MPQIRYYTVTQKRKVKVTANNHVNAILIAEAAFANGQNTDNGVKNPPEGIWGNTRNQVEVVDVHCEEGL